MLPASESLIGTSVPLLSARTLDNEMKTMLFVTALLLVVNAEARANTIYTYVGNNYLVWTAQETLSTGF